MATIAVHMDSDVLAAQNKTDRMPTDRTCRDTDGQASHPIQLTNLSDRVLRELLVANHGNVNDVWAISTKTDAEFEYLHKVKDSIRTERTAQSGTKKRKRVPEESEQTKVAQGTGGAPKSQCIHAIQDQKMAKTKEDLDRKRAQEEAKQEKARAKEAEKALREEAKRQKDEEKAKEKAKRDEERAKKDEERAKKERSQMRLNAFFTRKEAHDTSAGPSRRGSLEPTPGDGEADSCQQATHAQLSDLDRDFAPFFLHPNTQLATSRFSPLTESEVAEVISQFYHAKQAEAGCNGKNALLQMFGKCKVTRPVIQFGGASTKDLVARATGDATHPVAFSASEATNAIEQLREAPLKFLKYNEDVRPPYIGTFTKRPVTSVAKVCRRPFTRAFETMNYDYDSEAEWEEPEEGEDLGSEGEEEVEEDEEDEMEDFIDDEGAEQPSPKRQHTSDLVPKCTGVHWASEAESSVIPYGDGTVDMAQYQIVHLLPGVTGGIDPWSTKYWEPEASTGDKDRVPAAKSKSMPPRGPTSIMTREVVGLKRKRGSAAPVEALPLELMQDFKVAVIGKTLTKVGMVEVLKDKFPQVPKTTLVHTLEQIAKREGEKDSQKKWVAI